MPVNSIVTLAMVNDHHFPVAGEAIGVNHGALFDRPDFFPNWGIDVNTFANNFSAELRMFEFAERRDHLARYGPIHFPPQRFKTPARRSRKDVLARPIQSAFRDLLNHFLEPRSSGFHFAQ